MAVNLLDWDGNPLSRAQGLLTMGSPPHLDPRMCVEISATPSRPRDFRGPVPSARWPWRSQSRGERVRPPALNRQSGLSVALLVAFAVVLWGGYSHTRSWTGINGGAAALLPATNEWRASQRWAQLKLPGQPDRPRLRRTMLREVVYLDAAGNPIDPDAPKAAVVAEMPDVADVAEAADAVVAEPPNAAA